MRKETRIAYNGYLAQVAKLNGVDSAAVKFNVEPSVQQNLETAIQEATTLLGRINVIGVMDQSGEALLLGVNGPIASRTDTAGGNRRNPGEHHALAKDSYTCKQTNFDSAFRYALLDAWAKFPDFQTRLTAAIAQRQGLDRIMIGWNGTSAAAATNPATYPLRQDVNIGWLQKIRTGAPDRVLDEVVEASGKVTIGAKKIIKVAGVDTEFKGDYESLDGLVFDAVQMLDPWHRNHPDLVVIVSRNLMHEKLLAAVEKGATSNQEENAAQEIVTRARLGGLPVVDAPYFPDGTVLVTTLSNLSIYWQEGARRRHLKDEPEYDRIADYQSSNDAYVVEDFGLVALVENIQPFVYPAAS
ncbi:phage major capsid protein, P2 family [Pseudomonas aeruginosa]|uniref:phage major capsid protein, P2 family n=1 Tax=Pseudomonas aeruginosa TaxID=287 RepID=UPI00053E6E6A|nr:phage major capsid protein, P2 family [Pseudomonas aeruginosa]EIU3806590.1 phage major capsid protein, P2 family [Pseudomonas aeruginosa]EIU3914607.1 phage major capsid protein, P2 family [Pseudomonas aeruginosa]EIU3969343.1 phage major capsid protein, P2 family [Pseudomonas aeruginosa]WGW30965.1 phage major capsid protein, P2 family [Pseudomonas aeruginosa]WGW43481.1 phage major capsid protein, P2 family [Pseudomonas aeruginosa]